MASILSCVPLFVWGKLFESDVLENKLGLHPNLKAFETKQRMCKLIRGYLKKGPLLLPFY